MIAQLRGKLEEKKPNHVIMDVNGVGYELMVPISTYTALPDANSPLLLHVYTHVREDALVLFGFHSREEKALFEKLISVTGIGPKLGITVLSGMKVDDLVQAIRGGALERLIRIPGVGKKTAERILLELKDKLEGFGKAEPAGTPAHQTPPLAALDEDALSALVNLGCSRPAAEAAIRKVRSQGPVEDFETLFRKALEFVR